MPSCEVRGADVTVGYVQSYTIIRACSLVPNMRTRHLEDADDVRATIRINALAWREAYSEILPEDVLTGIDGEPSEEHVQEAFEDRRDDRDRILVAEDDDGTVRGYIYMRWGEGTKSFVGDDESELQEIYVHPDYWGRGIGTKLLERGLELVPEDITRIRLEMLSDNDVGHLFYESRGFDRTGTDEVEIAGESYSTEIYTFEQ